MWIASIRPAGSCGCEEKAEARSALKRFGLEMGVDFPEGRFWTGVKFVSGLATTRPESDSLQTETWNPIFSNSAQRHRDRRCGRAAVDRDW